jgi:hypothetical protein
MDVTVGDKRFDRYYREIRLGLRLMSHGARAQPASDWSGLSLDRLVTLRQRWMPNTEAGYRGQSPTSFLPFFRSTLKASHAAMFVGIFRMVGLHTCKPSLQGGEKLCEAYEIYLEWEPEEHLEFDYAVLLAMGAITREEIDLSTCESCEAALLLDRLKKVPLSRCARCRSSKKAGQRHNRVSAH